MEQEPINVKPPLQLKLRISRGVLVEDSLTDAAGVDVPYELTLQDDDLGVDLEADEDFEADGESNPDPDDEGYP